VSFRAIIRHRYFTQAIGALIAVACGIALLQMPAGERWENASYDYLFRFGTRTPTNQIVLIFMDNGAYKELHQVRGLWDRALHTRLLNQLADDKAALVIMDVFFKDPGEHETDVALAEAIRRNRVVLMAEQTDVKHPRIASAQPYPPAELFLRAATTWGVAWVYPDKIDEIVRDHWPFPSPGPYDSLPWAAARLVGANLSTRSEERWLRYYAPERIALSYHVALAQPKNYFRDKVVFIGNKPATTIPDAEEDEFRTPFTRWTGETSGGMEILATMFLNLWNHEWLKRTSPNVEMMAVVICGILLGAGLCRVGPVTATAIAVGSALGVTVLSASLTRWTNWWFPWLVIVGGQIPLALIVAVATSFDTRARERGADDVLAQLLTPHVEAMPSDMVGQLDVPEARDYEVFPQPFGHGAYGKVWLAKNAIGQWQAMKAVYEANFGDNRAPYDAEFEGIRRYKPISDKHPGLLRVDFVSRKKARGYYYYVMELGDSVVDGWQLAPETYKPMDLQTMRTHHPRRRLPVNVCVQIVAELADALHFLHQRGLTHRDIKPRNIIFVNGHPKLADVGLMTDIRLPEEVQTRVGTPGYMPPLPENPGTVQADIYALGMVLYVIGTGRDPALFPELSTTLVRDEASAEFVHLNRIILRACNPDLKQRYASAAVLHSDLLELLQPSLR
jgi:CHASE2 domain-containing sensor protein